MRMVYILILLLISLQTAYTASTPSIKIITIDIDGNILRYTNITTDTLIELDIRPMKDIQISFIAEVDRDQKIDIYSSLSKTLIVSKGAEVVNEAANIFELRALDQKVVVEIYGTYTNMYPSTIIMVTYNSIPLLIIRSKSDKGLSDIDKVIETLRTRISLSNISNSRKNYYENIVLKAIIAKLENDYMKSLEILTNAIDDLEKEEIKSRETSIIIQYAEAVLENNREKLPIERILECKRRIELAKIRLDEGNYDEAKRLATEAIEYATWTYVDELKSIAMKIILPIATIAILIIAIIVIAMKIYRNRRKSIEAKPSAIYKE